MRLVWMTVAAMLALLLPRFCGGVRRSNNSPASRLLPAGEYFEDIEVLYQLDELFRGISDWRLRSSLARALLTVTATVTPVEIDGHSRGYPKLEASQ